MGWQPPEKCPDLLHAMKVDYQFDAAEKYLEEMNRQIYFNLRHPLEEYHQDIIDKECKMDGLPLGWEKAKGPNNTEVFVDHFNRSVQKGPPQAEGPQSDGLFRARMPGTPRFVCGWRRYVKKHDSGYGPKRLFYYHLSSKTFQWQNPQLLHSSLFQYSTESLPHIQTPPEWDVRILERQLSNGAFHHIPVYFHKHNRYSSFDDPRATEAKTAMLRDFIKHNMQKKLQKVILEPNMFLNSIYAQLANWSTEELHPMKMESRFADSWSEKENREDWHEVSVQMINLTAREFASPELFMLVKHGLMDQCDIHPVSGSSLSHNDPSSWNVLKHFYVFGRFLGLALWINEAINLDLGPTIILPLMGKDRLSLNDLEALGLEGQDSGYTVFRALHEAVEKGLQEEAIRQELVFYSITFPQALPPGGSVTRLTNDGRVPLEPANPENKFSFVYYLRADAREDDPNCGSVYTDDRRMFDDVYRRTEAFITRDSFWPQVQALKNGFKDAMPLEWTRLFGPRELATLIGGEPNFDQTSICQYFEWVWDEDELRNRKWIVTPEQKANFEQRFVEALRARLASDTGDFAGNLLYFMTGKWHPQQAELKEEHLKLNGTFISDGFFWAGTCFWMLRISYAAYIEHFEPLPDGMNLFIDQLYITVHEKGGLKRTS